MKREKVPGGKRQEHRSREGVRHPIYHKYGLMGTPALVIDGQLKFTGKVDPVAETMGML